MSCFICPLPPTPPQHLYIYTFTLTTPDPVSIRPSLWMTSSSSPLSRSSSSFLADFFLLKTDFVWRVGVKLFKKKLFSTYLTASLKVKGWGEKLVWFWFCKKCSWWAWCWRCEINLYEEFLDLYFSALHPASWPPLKYNTWQTHFLRNVPFAFISDHKVKWHWHLQ